MEYDYVPISQRKPLKWPNGARVALILTFNLETWDLTKDTDKAYYAGGPPILPDVLPGNVPDFPNYCWREYGQRVGIWRLYDLFDEMGAKASCTTNAVTYERRRAMVDACLERGWELLAHNWEQGELLSDYAHQPEKERDIVLRSLDHYEKYTGRKAKGWLSSSLRGTLQTPAILAEYGCTFYCDLLNDDQPYLIRTPKGPIVSTPYTNEINDFTMLTRRNYTTSEFAEILKDELDVLYAEGEEAPKMLSVGMHCRLLGRPGRMRALQRFLDHIERHDRVWVCRRIDIARHWKQVHPYEAKA